MPDLRLVFFGTPDFAVPPLQHLVEAGFAVVGVVTQPDKPRGRGQKASAAPVKMFADAHGLPVLQPERLKEDAFLSALAELRPDVGVVAAYGKILPQAVLDVPRLGLVNVHASLLPRWRGASPVHRAVMAGDARTGVSIMRVVRELDAGGVFATVERPIGPEETSDEVERDLAQRGAELLVSVLADLEAGTARETPQDASGVSYAPRLTREEGLISWDASAKSIHDQVRGLHPWPHAYTFLDEARVIVLRTRLSGVSVLSSTPGRGTEPLSARPGEVLGVADDGLAVMAGDGNPVVLARVQLEGRRPVSGREFAAGARLKGGARLGTWPR